MLLRLIMKRHQHKGSDHPISPPSKHLNLTAYVRPCYSQSMSDTADTTMYLKCCAHHLTVLSCAQAELHCALIVVYSHESEWEA
eukprot:g80716.t1